ncbi:lipopolysaccharide-induced tumor necrosis factor-alpha factor homolog isoform X2 [Episyrphus balteatus]|uniref:lipopolysaccharide-induced tumor necrosis factor-alpha factor homolog isoform X2 n=1 Tax=Episyrphus balteatus TaxID=286459 RepID=UPI002484EDC5|nr:lipopolysaccharide-induced tumor necrosis factor-alpha factor homolog isoform X2 [Episyrphus balteatus]
MPSQPPPVYVQTPGYSQPIPAQYYNGQQGGYNPNLTQQPACVVITQQPIVAGPYVPIAQSPSRLNCPNCHADVLTNVKYEPNTQTHLIALCLCLFVCWPCVCLPYCMDSCQNANHYCPNCNAFIGTYQS